MTPVTAATEADVDAITRLEDAFPRGERWSRALWVDEVTGADRHVGVVRHDSGVVAAATFQVVVDVADLHRIVVAPEHRRRGLAGALLGDGCDWARGRGATRMLLEVRHTNTAALAFYEAGGFTRIAERRDYYAPGAHAVVMERPLTTGGIPA